VDGKAIIARLVRTFGRPIKAAAPGLTHLFPRPEVIASGNLSSIVTPPARAETLRALARATCEGKLNPAASKSLDDIISRLCAIHGMGRRRANYIAMRAFGEPDAFPCSDMGLRRALTSSRRIPSEDEFCTLAESWRPWRAYGAICLWAEDMDHCARGGRSAFLSMERPESRPIRPRTKEHQNPACVRESNDLRG
jgi:3-methyladenine DNA glycosylase/8-oxoguanine DNA glycosylase